jgi:hypothetical protein
LVGCSERVSRPQVDLRVWGLGMGWVSVCAWDDVHAWIDSAAGSGRVRSEEGWGGG